MYVCLTWGLNCGFTSNKPTHYQLDFGDFNLFFLLQLMTTSSFESALVVKNLSSEMKLNFIGAAAYI